MARDRVAIAPLTTMRGWTEAFGLWAGRHRSSLWMALIAMGIVGDVLFAVNVVAPVRGLTFGADALSDWTLNLAHPYVRAIGNLTAGNAFRYAPPIAFLFAPAHLLPVRAFEALWSLGLVALVYAIGRRWAWLLLLFTPVVQELYFGNIHLWIAAAILVGFRYPAAWSLVLLTKISPGVGLLWFAVRREWRSLAIALGTTAVIALGSALLAPDLWAQWIAMLRSDIGQPDLSFIPVLLPIRLIVAAAVVTWGALTDRRWTVPVAATLALPTIWFHGLSVLVAALPLAVDVRRPWSRHDPLPRSVGESDASAATRPSVSPSVG